MAWTFFVRSPRLPLFFGGIRSVPEEWKLFHGGVRSLRIRVLPSVERRRSEMKKLLVLSRPDGNIPLRRGLSQGRPDGGGRVAESILPLLLSFQCCAWCTTWSVQAGSPR